MKRSFVGTLFTLVLVSNIFLPFSRAEAGELTTSESIVMYARECLQRVLGDQYQLVQGSIDVEDLAGVDVGNAVRGIFKTEKKRYDLTFRVKDKNNQEYLGSTKMLVQAISSMDEDKDQDNNTALRGYDLGTGRLIKAQLQVFSAPSVPVAPKSLFLKPITK